MNATIKKLNYKDQEAVAVLEAPTSFEAVLEAWKTMVSIDTALRADTPYDFVLAFALAAADITRFAGRLKGNLVEDPLLWIAYPKKSSKKYTSDISRDHDCWQVLGDMGYEGVRQVAIDEDWSALRFRPADRIKSLKRDPKRAMSREGKKRTK